MRMLQGFFLTKRCYPNQLNPSPVRRHSLPSPYFTINSLLGKATSV
jgi:hypothetical protein